MIKLTEQLCRAILDAAPDPLAVLDDTNVVCYANAQFSGTFGYQTSELVGRELAATIPLLRSRADCARAAAPCVGLRKDGTTVALEAQFQALPFEDQDLLIVALRGPPRGDGLARFRSDLISSMSHVLRTPLNSIIGFSKLMHHGRVGAVSPKHREYLGDILNSANRLLSLINDLTDLSRIDAGRLEFRPERVDLPQLLGEVKEILAGLALSRRTSIESAVDPSCYGAELDPARLKQILYTLLSSALERCEGGRISMKVLNEGDKQLRIEVEISSRSSERDFLDQFLADDERRPSQALMRRMVEAQGGSVGIRCPPAGTACVFALLPRRMPKPALAGSA